MALQQTSSPPIALLEIRSFELGGDQYVGTAAGLDHVHRPFRLIPCTHLAYHRTTPCTIYIRALQEQKRGRLTRARTWVVYNLPSFGVVHRSLHSSTFLFRSSHVGCPAEVVDHTIDPTASPCLTQRTRPTGQVSLAKRRKRRMPRRARTGRVAKVSTKRCVFPVLRRVPL